MEQTQPLSSLYRPVMVTMITGYFFITWLLILWTTLYIALTSNQALFEILTNLRWFNITILTIPGILLLGGTIAGVIGIFSMKKWGVYVLLTVVIAALLLNVYSAPAMVFSQSSLILKMIANLIAVYLCMPIIAVVIGFKYFKHMR